MIIGHESIDASLGGVPPETAKGFNFVPQARVDTYSLNERHKSKKGANYIY